MAFGPCPIPTRLFGAVPFVFVGVRWPGGRVLPGPLPAARDERHQSIGRLALFGELVGGAWEGGALGVGGGSVGGIR